MTFNLRNVACGVSIAPQFRLLFTPWLEKKASTVLCCSRRECSSSSQFPVRYVPNKSLKPNEHEKAFRERGLERVNTGSFSGDRAHSRKPLRKGTSFLLDDRLHCVDDNGEEKNSSSSLMEELSHSIRPFCEPRKPLPEVAEGEGIRPDQNICELNAEFGTAVQDAEKLVIELLARRAYTAVELRKKLLGKRFSPEVVDLVIIDIESRGLINDSLYAETYTRSRWSSSTWGPRRIKQALFKKGVSEADAENAVKLVFQDGVSGHQESALGMSQNSIDQLLVQASKQWMQSRDKPEEKRKARIVRWLQYRGFNWSITCFILNKLQSLYPP